LWGFVVWVFVAVGFCRAGFSGVGFCHTPTMDGLLARPTLAWLLKEQALTGSSRPGRLGPHKKVFFYGLLPWLCCVLLVGQTGRSGQFQISWPRFCNEPAMFFDYNGRTVGNTGLGSDILAS
jgi:hypothetical protein